MTKTWLYTIALSMAVAGSGCIYESFESPTLVAPGNSTTMDAGSDASDMSQPSDGGVDMATNDAAADIGADADADAEIPTGPWNCPATELSATGDTSGKVQIEAVGDGWFVAWKSEAGSIPVRAFDAEGDAIGNGLLLGEIYADSDQPFHVLGPPTDEPAVEDRTFVGAAKANGDIEIYDCSLDDCTRLNVSIQVDSVNRIAGFWNGGEELPYFAAISSGSPALTVFTLQNFSSQVDIMTSEPIDVEDVRLESNGLPANPTLTSPVFAHLVTDGTLATASRLTSADPINQNIESCGVSPGNVGDVEALFAQPDRIIADITSDGDVAIARLECNGGTSEMLTSALADLRDWDFALRLGAVRTFYAEGDSLRTRLYSGELLGEDVIANKPFSKVSVASTGDRIGLATIDDDGVVEFRTMNRNGDCL